MTGFHAIGGVDGRLTAVLAPLQRSPLPRQFIGVGDDAASTRVYIIVVLLVVIGVALVVLAVWLLRATRPDRELLAPLERMDASSWRRLDPQDRRRALDALRPDGAFPLDRAKQEPTLDSEFAAGPVRAFTDLLDDDAPSSDALVDATPPNDDLASVLDGDGTTDTGPVAVESVDVDPMSPSAPSVPSDVVPTTATPWPIVAQSEPTDDETDPIARRRVAATDDEVVEEFEDGADFDIPLMPGEGLLRRPRGAAERD